MSGETDLKQAIELIKAGDKRKGGELLSELVKREPDNEMAWLWLTGCFRSDDRKRYCLQKAIEINPNNERAKQALANLTPVDSPTLDELGITTSPAKPPTSAQPIKRPVKLVKEKPKKSKVPLFILVGTSVVAIICGAGIGLYFLQPLITNPTVQLSSQSIAAPTETLETPALTTENTPTPFPSPTLSPTLSPEQEYAKEMKVALQKLAFMIDGPKADWDRLLSSKWYEILTYQDYLVYYQRIGEDQSPQANQKLTFAANAVINAGFDVTTELGSITPPASIKVAHNEIYACVQYQIDAMSAIINFLDTGVFNEAVSKCRAFPAALEKVLLFVEQNGVEPPTIENKMLF